MHDLWGYDRGYLHPHHSDPATFLQLWRVQRAPAAQRAQHFYDWLSPPGLVRVTEGLVVLLSFIIFACVASTLVWDVQYGTAAGTLHAYGTYPNPHSAKVTMMAAAALRFLASAAILLGGFSRAPSFRGRRFYLLVVVLDSAGAAVQGIVTIVYVIGINPAAQSSQSVLYNPALMMCRDAQSSGSTGSFPIYSPYLQHYCYMDPQEAVATVCGFLVVAALAMAACWAQKTRSKMWRHGKHNIYWERRQPNGHSVEEWSGVAPVLSEPTRQNVADSTASSTVTHSSNPEGASPTGMASPSTSQDSPGPNGSQNETGYATGGESAGEQEIHAQQQRLHYRQLFDSQLRDYKRLCAEMEDIHKQLSTLSHQLDLLEEDNPKRQAVAEEYNHLKDIKRGPDYQAKKRECRELQQKLCHIKRLVKSYDRDRL